ncbi:DUF4157 domain-containing protein [Phenylobacterium sp.]|uniref:DUF4157 domain-containing protein n=1 Tax=Phenylobacterium sp. TaxID=1871053 RepID=UPI003D28775E
MLAKMEAAFGADFSGVRVHVGPQASRIGAVAFTMGDDVYFAPGKFQPDSAQGQQLIGHELAHVIQQRQGRVRAPGSGVAVVQDRMLEAEADRLGMRAAAMRPRRPSATVQRAAASGRPLALRGAIQREPLAKVAVNRRTPLRQSHDGLSLSSGADIGVLDPGTEIEIDLGDQWLSRLGDGAVGDAAAHTWYRVVKHGGNAVRADIYLRGGTFDVVGQTTAAQGYVVCFRFCNAQDPETFKSHLSKGKSWSSPNKPRADLPESLLKRAMSHMDGAIEKSPFVSVATSEQALLRFGHSGGLKNVIFGATVPAERAPHIAIFHIPEGRLVSPAFLKATVHGAAQFIGLARAQVETELVYYGDDIQTYMIRYKDNPYNVHHYQALLAELDTD